MKNRQSPMELVRKGTSSRRDIYRIRYGLRSHVAGLPVLEQETVQLGSGSGIFSSLQALGRDLVIFESRVEPKLYGHVVADPAWMVVMLPISWRGEYIFKGIAARPHDVFITCDPSGYSTVGEARFTMAFAIRRSRLEKAMRALTGGADVPPIHDQRLVLDMAQSAALRKLAFKGMEAALRQPLDDGRFALPQAVESDTISVLSSAMLCQPEYCVSRDPSRLPSVQVVRAAARAIEAGSGENVSLAELCEASGVSQAWLTKCFHDVCGTSPAAYLRARRLTEARVRLLDQPSAPGSVKDVALSLGFWHLGRFAADYRALFEEKPSDSLKRSAQNSGPDSLMVKARR